MNSVSVRALHHERVRIGNRLPIGQKRRGTVADVARERHRSSVIIFYPNARRTEDVAGVAQIN